MLRTTQHRNQLTYTHIYHDFVYVVETECMEKYTEIRQKDRTEKFNELINEFEMKFYLLYNSICKK